MASPISRYRSIGCERRHLSPNGETMTIRSLTPALSVSPQIDPADVVALAASGFRSIVCNRPDGEEAGQPTAAAIAAAAEAHGLRFVHIPVMSGGRSEEHTSELQSLMRISYAVFCLKKNNNLIPTST